MISLRPCSCREVTVIREEAALLVAAAHFVVAAVFAIVADAPGLSKFRRAPAAEGCNKLMSESGQTRKSETAARMSVVGGKAEVEFGRRHVCF